MPKVYRIQKEREQFLIREFVEHLGYRMSIPKWPERPDALLTICNGRGKRRIAIELTDHYNDTIAGQPSPLTTIDEFWRLVETSLMRRISHRKHLMGIVGGVRFKDKVVFATANGKATNTARQTEARDLAKEIVEFTEANPVDIQSTCRIFRSRDFSSNPTLVRLLDFLRLSRATDKHIGASRCSWNCSNITTGHVGLNLNYIKSSIASKNKKAVKYENWGDATEKWLVIVSGGGNVSTHAGSMQQVVEWNDPDLIALCRDSSFDRIAVWERVRGWLKWLRTPSAKPSPQSISGRN